MPWGAPSRREVEQLKDHVEALDDRGEALKGRLRGHDGKLGSLTQRTSRLEHQVREILSYLHSLDSRSSADTDPEEPVDEEGDVEDRRLRVADRG